MITIPCAHAVRRLRASFAASILLLAMVAWLRAAVASTVPDGFRDERVVGSLSTPVGIAFVPDGRLLVVEQNTARIRLIVNDALGSPDPLVVVPNLNGGGEGGLLGIAVDPQWLSRPYIYVHATVTVGGANRIRISRYTAGGDLAFTGDGQLTIDPGQRYDLITDIPDAVDRHNGGTLRFGPDGHLYVSLGEDGTRCAAQDTSSLRGVILRLDVSRLPAGPGGPPARSLITPPDNPLVSSGGPNGRLIYAWGLRNPFRFQVDRSNGALFVGDVGEGHWEEIDRVDQGGRNFGWPLREGPSVYSNDPCVGPALFTAPIYSLDRTGTDGAAIVSAALYRRPPGATNPFPIEYEGSCFFSEYYSGTLRRLVDSGASWVIAPEVPGQPSSTHWGEGFGGVTDFQIAPDGALWYCRQSTGGGGTGEVRRIVIEGAIPPPPPDTVLGLAVEFAAPYPLPAEGTINLVYDLSRSAEVELVIYDVRGRLTRRLVTPETQSSGPHAEVWDGLDDDGRPSRSGIYFARLIVNGSTFDRRLNLVR